MSTHLILVEQSQCQRCFDNVQRCFDNAHRKGHLSSTLYIPQLRQLTIPRADGHGLHTVNGKVGQTVSSCRKTWLKSRWSSPKRKMTIKNTQSLRILMASGLRLTYMSKLDMYSVSLNVRDIHRLWYLWLGKIHSNYNDASKK